MVREVEPRSGEVLRETLLLLLDFSIDVGSARVESLEPHSRHLKYFNAISDRGDLFTFSDDNQEVFLADIDYTEYAKDSESFSTFQVVFRIVFQMYFAGGVLLNDQHLLLFGRAADDLSALHQIQVGIRLTLN